MVENVKSQTRKNTHSKVNVITQKTRVIDPPLVGRLYAQLSQPPKNEKWVMCAKWK